MPTYAYRCTACEHAFEIHQAFTDDALTTCPECSGALRKLFTGVGVVFKGSGFYRTDSRSGSSSSVPANGSSSNGSSSNGASSNGSSSNGSSSGSAPSGSASSGSKASATTGAS